MDNLTPEARSRHMRGVRRRNTKPELVVRRTAHALGFRFRLHRKDLPGSPDLAFPGRRKAIFVHGCFWHGHRECRYATVPKTRTDWWLEKISNNQRRDARALTALDELGWNSIVIWECETRKADGLAKRLQEFLKRPLDLDGSSVGRFGQRSVSEKCR